MDLAAQLGGIFHWLLGSQCCICTPCKVTLAFLMDKVTPSMSLPLSVHCMAQTSSPSSSLHYVGDHVHGLFCPRRASYRGDIPPACAGSGEGGSWKGRGSRWTLPRLSARTQLHCSLQLMKPDSYMLPRRKSLQQDTGTVPLLPWIWLWRASPEAMSHPRYSHLPIGRRNPHLPSSLRSCRSFRAETL